MSEFYTLTTVSGYTQLVRCAQSALEYALEAASYANCQRSVGPLSYASCLCSTASSDVQTNIDGYHSGGCPLVTVWGVSTVFQEFCSVELGQASPITSAGSVPSPLPAEFYTLTTVSDYTQLVECAQSALEYALEAASYANCQRSVGPLSYAYCLCSTASSDVQTILDAYRSGACPSVTVWGATSVFQEFCVVELSQSAVAGSSSLRSTSPVLSSTSDPATAHASPTISTAISTTSTSVASADSLTGIGTSSASSSIQTSQVSSSGNTKHHGLSSRDLAAAIIVPAILLAVAIAWWQRKQLRNLFKSRHRHQGDGGFRGRGSIATISSDLELRLRNTTAQ